MIPEYESIRKLAEDYDSDQDDFGLFGDSDYDNFEDRFVRPLATRFRPSPTVGGARVNTGTGSMPVQFAKPPASAEAIELLKQDTQRAISEVRADFSKLRADTDRQLKATGRQLKATNDRLGSMQQTSMLMALLPALQRQPSITSITLPGDSGGEVKANTPLTPTNVQFERPDMTMMLLPLLLGGGLGGSPGTTGSGQNDMMLLVVALMASQRR